MNNLLKKEKMKNIIIVSVIALISCLGKAQTAEEIVVKVQNNERIRSTKGTAKQIITTSNGSARTLEMESYTKNFNESQLSIYTSPARINGDKILMLNDGDDIWFYTPKTDRIRHLASHAKKQKVQGSDFSYEDYENWDYKNDFHSVLLKEEKIGATNCFKLELTPTETGPHYSKMIIWVDKEKYVTVKADYYEEGELLKTLQCKDLKKFDGHWMPMKMIMTNRQDGGTTIMETLEIQINVDLDDSLFTTNYLQKR